MVNPEIWTKKGLSQPTSKGSIRLANVTANDIENMRAYGKIVGEVWEEEKFYTIVKSDIMKLDFIPFLAKDQMSDEDLDKIIAFETIKEHSAGSYSAISLGTVNQYLVDHVIYSYNKGDMDAIKPFTL